MISVDDIPIGGAPTKCQLCGMVARPPIVIPERAKDGTFADVGVCRNTRVCNPARAMREADASSERVDEYDHVGLNGEEMRGSRLRPSYRRLGSNVPHSLATAPARDAKQNQYDAPSL
jgi:hypothetical protein